MSFLDSLREQAKTVKKKIVLPEGDDKRIVEAGQFIRKNNISDIIVLKKGQEIERFDEMVDRFREIRRQHKKNISRADAVKLFLEKNVYVAAMMVRLGMADGFVAGASCKTSEVARAALCCLSIDRNIGVMSGCFIIEVPDSAYGEKGVFIFSDCGIVPFPNKEQLTGIALSAAKFAGKVLKVTPRVAVLSYSTKGSTTPSSNLNSIRDAVSAVKKTNPEICIDGELQVDSALDPEVAKIKHSIAGSDVAGRANVLIFPNLDSGNIAYKLAQRLAKARAVGPILLGLEKPCSDLSRACSTNDIIDTVAITNVMVQ